MTGLLNRFRIGAAVAVTLTAFVRWMYPPPENRIVIAVFDESGTTLRNAVESFKKDKDSSKIEVQLREFTYDDLNDQVLKHLADYDVVMVDHPWLYDMRDKLRPLSMDPADRAQLTDTVMKAISVGCLQPSSSSCVIGMPYVGNSQLFAINRRLLPNAPWPKNWDEVVTLASRSGKEPQYMYALRGKFDDDSSVTDEFMPVYWWALDRNHNDTTLARTQAVGVLTALAAGSPPGAALYGSYDVSALLLRGEIAMGLTWPDWAMQMTLADAHAVDGIDFGLPPGDAPELGIWVLGIPHTSKHPDHALRFINFATTKKELKTAALAGNPPLRKDLLNDPELMNTFPSFKAQLRSLEAARERPAKGNWHDCNEKKIGGSLRKVYYGKISQKEAADTIGTALPECH